MPSSSREPTVGRAYRAAVHPCMSAPPRRLCIEMCIGEEPKEERRDVTCYKTILVLTHATSHSNPDYLAILIISPLLATNHRHCIPSFVFTFITRRLHAMTRSFSLPTCSLISGNAYSHGSPSSSLDHSSGDSGKSTPSSETVSGAAAAGLYISGPLSPPVGYPMPGSHHPMRGSVPPEDNRASVISSSSSGSSQGGSVKGRPTPPQWAQPPMRESGARASSFDSGLDRGALDRPNVPFNTEHVRGPAGEWAELLRGEQGRIAIKSTPSQHEVLVWLPGFS